MDNVKSNVFVITPFNEDFLALYDEIKETFKENFEFTNAGDLDNQQNILQDIVEGIHQADVVIADLTGLNANVFYELGLAHAMNKKVVIITQDINELPFDIKSYRANEYSLQFNKLPKLIEELKKLLFGAIDNTIKYGNPVSDYLPDFFNFENMKKDHSISQIVSSNGDSNKNETESIRDGFLDNISELQDNSQKMIIEINSICDEMGEMNNSVTLATNEINKVKAHSGNVDASFVRNICRKLSSPIETFAGKLKNRTENINNYWNIVENNYLSLLDNQFIRKQENIESLSENLNALEQLQIAIDNSNSEIKGFIKILHGNLGMERRLNKAITLLINELETYLSMTDTMYSSIDRITTKGEIVIKALN